MSFTPFDLRLLEEGTDFFSQPRLACLLESLGRTGAERTTVVAQMLRNSCLEDLEEVVRLFERGVIRDAMRRLRLEERERGRDTRPGDR